MPLPSLNILRHLFIDGWKYILRNGPQLQPLDFLMIKFLIREAENPHLTLEQLGALAVLSPSMPNANFGFEPIEPITGVPVDTTCFQFGQGRVGWYFMYGNSTTANNISLNRDNLGWVDRPNVGFTYIIFRLELAPPAVVKAYNLEPSEAVLYSIVSGCGSTNKWWSLPKTIVRAKYRCLSDSTFEFVSYPTQGGLGFFGTQSLKKNIVGSAPIFAIQESDSSLIVSKFRSPKTGFFQLRTKWIDPQTKEPITIKADLKSSRLPVYNGPGGCVPCIGGYGSLYWSYTDIEVKMNVGNPKVAACYHRGTGWFDHQWTATPNSDQSYQSKDFGHISRSISIPPFSMKGADEANVLRWLWLTLQLDNQTQYMIVVTGFQPSDIRKGQVFDAILVNKYLKNSAQYNIGGTKVEILDSVLIGKTEFPTKYRITITENGVSTVYILKNAFGKSIVNMFTGSINWEGPGNTYNEDESQLIGTGFLEANQLQSAIELIINALNPLFGKGCLDF